MARRLASETSLEDSSYLAEPRSCRKFHRSQKLSATNTFVLILLLWSSCWCNSRVVRRQQSAAQKGAPGNRAATLLPVVMNDALLLTLVLCLEEKEACSCQPLVQLFAVCGSTKSNTTAVSTLGLFCFIMAYIYVQQYCTGF